MTSSNSSAADDRLHLLQRLQPSVDRARNFSGWDLSFVDPTNVGAPLPWDYEALAQEYISPARRVLDLGTGGGEVLSRVAAGQQASFVATEEWHVNAPVARARLRPLGIPVNVRPRLLTPLAVPRIVLTKEGGDAHGYPQS